MEYRQVGLTDLSAGPAPITRPFTGTTPALFMPCCLAVLRRMRYDMRPDSTGWTVYDVATDRPVVLDDVVLTGINFEDADTLVNLLNALDLQSIRKRVGSRRAF